MMMFIFPYDKFYDWVLILNIFQVVFNIAFFRAAFKDPGSIKKVKDIEFENLVETLDPNQLCPDCETVYSQDVRHCFMCNKCIYDLDHHCTWINNCVGNNNFKEIKVEIIQLGLSVSKSIQRRKTFKSV